VSLDLEVYAVRPTSLAELRANLPEGPSWEDYGAGELAYDSDGWQVLVGEPEEIAPEDVPGHLRALLPDACWLISLTLEPIGAAEDGKAFLERVLSAVGSATGGVSTDFRTGTPCRFSS